MTEAAIVGWAHGRGVDAVLMTAATTSSDPMRRSPALCRGGAKIVLVGDVGLDLERTPLYEKELIGRVKRRVLGIVGRIERIVIVRFSALCIV